MFEFLTKEGRAAMASRREQRRKEAIEKDRQETRRLFEAKQSSLPLFARAQRYFQEFGTTTRIYSSEERIKKDVEHLHMMMTAIDSGEELRQGWNLKEVVTDPMKEFHWRYYHFVTMYLADLKLSQEHPRIASCVMSIRLEEVEKIIRWAVTHNDDCARVRFYDRLTLSS